MIYLDYNATTPVDKRVLKAMLSFFKENFGNPSSSHKLGIKAKKSVEKARNQVSNLINCNSDEIIFTGTGSESNNTIIKGVAESYRDKGNHIITSQIEHPSVLEPCRFLEKKGFKITYLPVDRFGEVKIEKLKEAITEETILVSIMHSNNETGTLQPIKQIGEICNKNSILFHTDASQSLGKVKVDVKDLGVDFLTVAGHKLYAPKGIGAYYKKNSVNIESLIHGANHEMGRRAGTENVPYIVGLGEACEIAKMEEKSQKIKELTNYFYKQLKKLFSNYIVLNGHPERRLPNTLNVSFTNYTSNEIMEKLKNVAVSAGSACHSNSIKISPVLKAMNIDKSLSRNAIRFSLGRFTTKDEIDEVISYFSKLL